MGDLQRAEADSTNASNDAAVGFGRFSLLFGAELASRGLRFLADILLVRHFGQSAFGQLNVAQSLAVQGNWIATCGLNTAGVRDVAARPAEVQTIAATVVVLRCALASFTWAIIAGVSWLVPQYRDSYELVAVYGLSLFTGGLSIGWVAQARGDVRPAGLALLAAHLAYLGGVHLVVLQMWPLVCVPLVLVFGEGLTAAALWLWVVHGIGPMMRPLPLAAALRFLRKALPIGGANLLRGVMLGSDVLLLGLFVGKAEVGQYAAAFKLYSLGSALLGAYFAVLFPHLSSRAAESILNLRAAVSTEVRRTLLAAVPVTAAALLLAPGVLLFLFGAGFEDGANALRILVLALPFQLLAGQCRLALVALGRQRRDLGLVAFGTIVHVGAKLVLIPRFGISGAAWGTLASEGLLMLLSGYAILTVFRDGERR